jgi:hypothetical protein
VTADKRKRRWKTVGLAFPPKEKTGHIDYPEIPGFKARRPHTWRVSKNVAGIWKCKGTYQAMKV